MPPLLLTVKIPVFFHWQDRYYKVSFLLFFPLQRSVVILLSDFAPISHEFFQKLLMICVLPQVPVA